MTDLILSDEKLGMLERQFLELPQVECPVKHTFLPGLYIREVAIPADTYVIGHAQRFEHLFFLVEGEGVLVNADGSKVELKGPKYFVAPPGRKLGYCRTQVRIMNVYPNPDNERDVEKLEERFMDKSAAYLEAQERMKQLNLTIEAARKTLHRYGTMTTVIATGRDAWPG